MEHGRTVKNTEHTKSALDWCSFSAFFHRAEAVSSNRDLIWDTVPLRVLFLYQEKLRNSAWVCVCVCTHKKRTCFFTRHGSFSSLNILCLLFLCLTSCCFITVHSFSYISSGLPLWPPLSLPLASSLSLPYRTGFH